jgi:bifunctional DNA-binding transcriptional regulator/antitoxin component of YhaV-PrlF toxin-antitoxin module
MSSSIVTEKGQTTVPLEVRRALKVQARQTLEWVLQDDGTALVRPHRSAVSLYATLKSPKRYTGRKAERDAMLRSQGAHAAREGLD